MLCLSGLQKDGHLGMEEITFMWSFMGHVITLLYLSSCRCRLRWVGMCTLGTRKCQVKHIADFIHFIPTETAFKINPVLRIGMPNSQGEKHKIPAYDGNWQNWTWINTPMVYRGGKNILQQQLWRFVVVWFGSEWGNSKESFWIEN